MINDPLTEYTGPGEQVVRYVDLWAHVLVRGVQDFAIAEARRRHLIHEVKSESAAGAALVRGIDTFVQADIELCNLRRVAGYLEEAIQPSTSRDLAKVRRAALRKQIIMKSPRMQDVKLYLGRDEATEWFWSPIRSLGSFLQIYNLFESLPPVGQFQQMVLDDLTRYRSFSLEKVSRRVTSIQEVE